MTHPADNRPMRKKKGASFLPRRIGRLAPPHPHLLLSNIPPTEEERIDIRHSITLAQNELETLDKKKPSSGREYHVWPLRGSTRAVETKHASLAEYIRLHKGVISVVRLIPTEIWRLIFIDTLPPPSGNPTLADLKPNLHFPWVLTQVSRRWRDISLHTPELWTVFPKIALDHALYHRDRHESIIRLLLERSHTLPIDVCITELPSNSWYMAMAQLDISFLDFLFSFSKRWRKLNLELEGTTLERFQSIEGRLPCLEELTISTWRRCYIGSETISVTCFRTTPRLRSIDLSRSPPSEIVFASPSEPLPLRTNDPHSVYLDHIVYIFDPSSIREIKVDNCQMQAPISTRKQVTLPNLVVLDINFAAALLEAYRLFNYLKIPCLEELRLVSISRKLVHDVSVMIMNSSTDCLIKKLYIRVPFIPPGNLTNLLVLTPLLTRLSISLPSKGDILSLTATDTGQILVPLLQICAFHVGATLSGDTAQLLNEFASARCNHPPTSASASSLSVEHHQPRLRVVHLHFSNGPLHHVQRFLNRWVGTWEAFDLAEDKELLLREITKLMGDVDRTLDTNTSVLLHTLRMIKELEFKRAADIYRSGIHILFHRLLHQGPFENPNLRSLRRWANIILHKWEPIFKAEIDTFRWAIKFNLKSLVYISDSNPVRFSDNPTKMVYGIHDQDLGPLYESYPLDVTNP